MDPGPLAVTSTVNRPGIERGQPRHSLPAYCVSRVGTSVLNVVGKAVDTQVMERTIPLILRWDENLDICSDTLTGGNDADYQPPFAFTGKLVEVTLTIDRPHLSTRTCKKLRGATRNASE